MNRFSIPAFVENITPDTANNKYSHAKLKIFYIGQTADRRVFTKEFSDKLLSTIAYTPVVGFYSVAEEDFIGHNNVQNIYGIVPAETTLEYVEDEAQGVTFAVTDILLYTGRPDETGAIAAKIVGKQHSLELDPNSVKYKLNYDESGNFKNLEFTDGELIGLSVLGDNETPAFTGSEFFTTQELPDFITEENKNKFSVLFGAMLNVEPTAEEVILEIHKALDAHKIYGYVCEHKPEQYVVVCSEYGVYNRYIMSRNEAGVLNLSLDCSVRNRYISDEEIEILTNAEKGTAQNSGNGAQGQTNGTTASGQEATPNNNPSTSFGGENIEELTNELETLRGNYSSLETENDRLNNSLQEALANLQSITIVYQNALFESYNNLLSSDKITEIRSNENLTSAEDMINAFEQAYAELKNNTGIEVFEISPINNTTDSYDEKDEVAVVQKYKNMNRGKN